MSSIGCLYSSIFNQLKRRKQWMKFPILGKGRLSHLNQPFLEATKKEEYKYLKKIKTSKSWKQIARDYQTKMKRNPKKESTVKQTISKVLLLWETIHLRKFGLSFLWPCGAKGTDVKAQRIRRCECTGNSINWLSKWLHLWDRKPELHHGLSGASRLGFSLRSFIHLVKENELPFWSNNLPSS